MRWIVALLLTCLLFPTVLRAADVFDAASRGDIPLLKELLDGDKQLVNSKQNDMTPLYLAVQSGAVKAIALLLDYGADPNIVCDKVKYTPLHIACVRSAQGSETYLNIAKLLLEKGADPRIPVSGNRMPLHIVQDRDLAALLIAKGADVNAKMGAINPGEGHTPIFEARSPELIALLLDKGADLTVKDGEFGRTPLFYQLYSAACAGLLLDKGAEINVRDRNGMTPLFTAGDAEVVKLLVARGADANARDNDGRTPLYQAAVNGNTAVVQALVEAGADVKIRTESGSTLLHAAVMQDRCLDIAKFLLQQGLDINAADKGGFTPLLAACNYTSYATNDYLEWLVANGAEVKAKTADGRTALHLAAANDMRVRPEFAQEGDPAKDPRTPKLRKTVFLLKQGLDVNAKDNAGNTPLFYTMQHYEGCLEDEMVLLEAGADPNSKNAKGYTPLCGVFLRDTGRTTDQKRLPEMVKLLLDKGADPNVCPDITGLMSNIGGYDFMKQCVALISPKLTNVETVDNRGRTPLFAAVDAGDVAVVQGMLEKGANVNAADKNGERPLMQAKSLEMLQLLLDRGARVDVTTNYKQTPLHKLIVIATPEMVKLLLEKGVDPNALDMNGATALQYGLGSIYDRTTVYVYLFEHGAKGDVVDRQGNGLAHKAAERGKRDQLELVLKHGANPNLVNKEGNTPLHLATTGPVITCLLELGADPAAPNALGETPLHRIVRPGYMKAADVELLFAKNIDVNARDKGGATPLFWAGAGEVVKLLIAHGADMTARDNAGATPLHYAACDKGGGMSTDAIKALLAAGIDPNSKDNNGNTPLHWAASRTREGLIQALVAAGADVNARNAAGKTPFTVATEAKMKHIAETLAKEGGKE